MFRRKDGWIVNFGQSGTNPNDELDFRQLDNWHNDGESVTIPCPCALRLSPDQHHQLVRTFP